MKTEIICTLCGIEKSMFDFGAVNRRREYPCCKECSEKRIKEYSKTYRKKYVITPNSRYGTYRRSVEKTNRIFNLTFEEFMLFWQKPCSYCGDNIKTIGLDRVDNTKGYELENIVPCCTMCNRMKNSHTKERFLNQVTKIAEHLKTQQK